MVMLGRYAHQKMFGTDMVSEREKVLAGIREVGMEGFEERSFLSLSGGEKQRTLVARALVQQAKLIIKIADMVTFIDKGRIVDAGTPEEVFVPEKIRSLFGIDASITVNKATGRPNIMFIPQV